MDRVCVVCEVAISKRPALPLCESEGCHKRYFDALGDAVDADWRSAEAQQERADRHAGRDDRRGRWRW